MTVIFRIHSINTGYISYCLVWSCNWFYINTFLILLKNEKTSDKNHRTTCLFCLTDYSIDFIGKLLFNYVKNIQIVKRTIVYLFRLSIDDIFTVKILYIEITNQTFFFPKK